jgi:hypothetical protein
MSAAHWLNKKPGDTCENQYCARLGQQVEADCKCVGKFRAPLVCPKCKVSVYYCPCSLARIEGLRKSTREAIRVASKPRARLIKARYMCGVRDTWMVHKEFNGRIVRGYGYELDGAFADYLNMLAIAKNSYVRDNGAVPRFKDCF